ncbi:MAG: homoserine dehydrogenase, partial [Hyphomicrobiales bacterium]|nr:homoserine dehydrogenase [Hyphomicrobiales bacterium]
MFKQALDRRAEQGRPIQVGFVGAGRMGTGAICQIGLMRGIRNAIIADINTERVVRAFELCGHRREDVVVTNSAGAAADAIRSGKPVAAQDAEILSELPIDVIVEATGNPDIGARVAMRSILARKHIVMLNVETDVVVGPILYKMAQAA